MQVKKLKKKLRGTLCIVRTQLHPSASLVLHPMPSMLSVLLLVCVGAVNGLHLATARPALAASRAGTVRAGLFDVFKESEEQKRIKDEQLKAMKEMQRLRRDPEAWEAEISKRRNQEIEMMKAKMEGKNAVLENVDTLPLGWSAVVDAESGDTYYWNKDTGDTQWEIPV